MVPGQMTNPGWEKRNCHFRVARMPPGPSRKLQLSPTHSPHTHTRSGLDLLLCLDLPLLLSTCCWEMPMTYKTQKDKQEIYGKETKFMPESFVSSITLFFYSLWVGRILEILEIWLAEWVAIFSHPILYWLCIIFQMGKRGNKYRIWFNL